jgi:hypothetical protein
MRIWSHGPSFDPPILTAAYKATGLPIPWHYRAPRDTRTIMEAAGMDPHKGLEPFTTGTHHHALDDAICQARAVCAAYATIKGWQDGGTPQAIETCPKDGTLFDAYWFDDEGCFRRMADCHFANNAVQRTHGYPTMRTVFRPQPTHWTPRPAMMTVEREEQ